MLKDKKYFFSLLDPCRVVRGASVCAVYDLQNEIVKVYPKWVGDFIDIYNGKKNIEQILVEGFYSELEVDTLLAELLSRKFIIMTKYPGLFARPENQNKKPFNHSAIGAAVVDFDQNTDIAAQVSFFDELVENNCTSIDIRFYSYEDRSQVVGVVKKAFFAGLKDVEVYVNVRSKNDVAYFRSTFINFKAYYFLKKGIEADFSVEGVNLYEGHFTTNSCGIVKPENFTTGVDSFEKNMNFNECLSGKIGLDVFGNIKNCPSQVNSFGRIGDKLSDVLTDDGFNELRTVKKDDVEICKDCVYRYCCTDCRVFVSEPGNIYSKPEKCGYDPYTNTWNEVGQEFLTMNNI